MQLPVAMVLQSTEDSSAESEDATKITQDMFVENEKKDFEVLLH